MYRTDSLAHLLAALDLAEAAPRDEDGDLTAAGRRLVLTALRDDREESPPREEDIDG